MSEFTSTDKIYRTTTQSTTASSTSNDPSSPTYLAVTPRRVFASFNYMGILATITAAFLTLFALISFLTLVPHHQSGLYRQIYDPDFCGSYTITELPKRSALGTLTTPSSSVIPTVHCSIDRLTLTAFVAEFEAEPHLYSSCWQKVPLLDSGNFYFFLTKSACVEILDDLGDEGTFEFDLAVFPDPRLAEPQIQAERTFLRNLTGANPDRTDSVILILEIICIAVTILSALLWKRFVYDSVRRELYLSFLYTEDIY